MSPVLVQFPNLAMPIKRTPLLIEAKVTMKISLGLSPVPKMIDEIK